MDLPASHSGWSPLGLYKVRKTYTFSNDGAGALNILTVTGTVDLTVVVTCTTNLASAAAANMELGVASDTDAMIASTLATDLDADEIWHDASPDSDIEATSSAQRSYTITGGADVILTIDAQVDSGVLVFDCYWTPHSDNGNVTAA